MIRYPSHPPKDSINFAVVKIGNIPWEVSSKDICQLIEPHLWRSVPFQDWVHIPIDRETGKTLGDVYVEVPTNFEAQVLCQRLDKQIMKQRALQLSMSSYDELTAVLISPENLRMQTFISKEEVSCLIEICRNYKIYFSRKCAERPFEHVLSLLRIIPWHEVGLQTINLLFELLKVSIEALVMHRSRPSCQIDESLLFRMVQAGLAYPVFSRSQKEAIQRAASIMSCWKANLSISSSEENIHNV